MLISTNPLVQIGDYEVTPVPDSEFVQRQTRKETPSFDSHTATTILVREKKRLNSSPDFANATKLCERFSSGMEIMRN